MCDKTEYRTMLGYNWSIAENSNDGVITATHNMQSLRNA
jgi:hypothetical protein